MTMPPLHIVELYPRDMNIYGDSGNTLALVRRAQWRGYDPVVSSYDPGDEFPSRVDVLVGGGGQDSGQSKIQDDLTAIGPRLHELAERGTPMLMICGLYQLFGHFFQTAEGTRIEGIGLLDVTTYAQSQRLIGNVVTRSTQFGDIIGYENHSGQTRLGEGVAPLGIVTKGMGNDTESKTEGARYRNVIGSYLHGSLLPKNPRITDFLLEQAALNRYGSFQDVTIDDSVTELARKYALTRPR